VAFTNTSNEPVAISDLEIHGDFAARDVYNIGLYFGTTGTTRIASAASTTGDKAVFSGMRMLVPTGGSITLAVKADINSSTAKSALYYAFQYYFLAKATGATSGTAATLNATQGTSSLSVTGRTPTTTTNPTTAPATTTTPGTTPTTTATDTTTTPAATAPTTSANPTTATPTYSPAPTTALSPISTNTSAGSASAPQPVRTAPAPSTTAATVPASALTASPAPALSSDPAALNLNNTANFPLTKNTRGCYSLSTQTAEKVTFQLSGPATRILDATTEPGGIYCCNFTVSDLPNGTYNLSISIYNAGSINTQSRSIVVNKPSAQEALTQNSAAILQGKCQALGITDAQQCRSTVLDQYARDIRCQDLSTTDCHATLKETYADDVIVLEDRYQRIAENVKGSVGKDLRVSELEQVLNRNAPVADIAVPLQDKGIRVKALGAASEIMLDRTQGIVEAAPVAIAIDSDGDSVPDDIEKRLGTDANSADTDGDGYTDSEEVRGGFNPLGEGMKTLGLAPIEEAILKNLPLSHPKTGGVEREALQVSSVTNAPATGSKAEAGAGYVLSGKAVPNSVITLYIYSDIPVVTTVSTDQDGNWQYEFKQALSDGDHEVYVAVNDDTGKVVSKSKPFDFTVKQAKAISPSDLDGLQADAHAVATPSAQTTSGAAYYILLVVGLLIVTSILIFAFLILKKRKLKS
jgi:hypothetical protein